MGYGRSTSQLMTIPIYCAASVIAVVVAWLSDKAGRRSPFLLGCYGLVVLGLAMYVLAPLPIFYHLTNPLYRCLGSSNPRVVYGGLIIAACGMYPASPTVVTWLANNLSGSCKRSVGMAVQMSFGNLGGAMASNFYRGADAPRYIMGHSLSMGFVIAGITAASVIFTGYFMTNKKRSQAVKSGQTANYTEAQLAALGDKAITWRYMY